VAAEDAPVGEGRLLDAPVIRHTAAMQVGNLDPVARALMARNVPETGSLSGMM
jgi:hypothetical protein